jgi:response regulator RpfG family c-di-GMP phosphodiesterase
MTVTTTLENRAGKVLCVDDEPRVLSALSLHLRRRYTLFTATSGAEALEILRREGDIAVIVADMRMPGMDGSALLSAARELTPDTIRILLTGDTDIQTAMSAVNEGQLFRFLLKPCPASVVATAIDAATVQHRLVATERVLLEQTLHGSIRALTDVLAVSNPTVFGRAVRLRQHVAELAANVGMRDRWQVEVAAMLSQIGTIALPPEIAEKAYRGGPLTAEEQGMIDRVPEVAEQLLGSIPRLETVRGIIAAVHRRPPAPGLDSTQRALIDQGARLLKVAIDFDVLESEGNSPALALDTMRGRNRYDPLVLDAFEQIRDVHRERDDIRQVSIGNLQVGMILVDDVHLLSGALLVGRGYEVTASFAERGRNFRDRVASSRVRVIMPRPAPLREPTTSALG